MHYPTTLLPETSYRILQFDDLPPNLYLVRHTETIDILDEYGGLKSECVALQTDHLRDYSTNLLGEFAPEDCRLQLLKTGPNYSQLRDLWQEETPVLTPSDGVDFDLSLERGWFFLKVDDFHQASFGTVSKDLPVLPTCTVLHTPINCNYWHCSLRWILQGVDLETVKGNKYVLKLARSFIIENAIFNEPAYQALPPEVYQKEDQL